MHWIDRRIKIRSILDGDVCIHPGSVFDAMSARIAEDLGYEVGVFAGSVASMSVLGAPDSVVITLTELSKQAYRINRAFNIPLIVDADHGYGNALNVKRAVEELETSGAASLTIEDTNLPRPYKSSKPQLISLEEGVGKLKAALNARCDKNLVIIGRTSAISVSDIRGAIKRAVAYERTGVDAIMIVGINERKELEALCENISLPIILAHNGSELEDLSYLESLGVRISFQPHLSIHAAIKSVHDVLSKLYYRKKI